MNIFMLPIDDSITLKHANTLYSSNVFYFFNKTSWYLEYFFILIILMYNVALQFNIINRRSQMVCFVIIKYKYCVALYYIFQEIFKRTDYIRPLLLHMYTKNKLLKFKT